MRLVWALIPLLIVSMIGIVGIQYADATWKSSQNYTNNWHLGEELKEGDYFSYDIYYTLEDTCSLQLCKSNDPLEFQIDFWIKGDEQIGNDRRWLAKVVVYDGNKIINGEMELGKIRAVPVESSEELEIYHNVFKSSVGWLSAFGLSYESSDEKKIEKSSLFPNPNIGISYPPLEIETITVSAGIWETIVASWMYNGYASKIWVVDNFPFPIKAHTLTHVSEGIPPIEYKFELLDYRENIFDDPFVPVHIPKSFTDESKISVIGDNIDFLSYEIDEHNPSVKIFVNAENDDIATITIPKDVWYSTDVDCKPDGIFVLIDGQEIRYETDFISNVPVNIFEINIPKDTELIEFTNGSMDDSSHLDYGKQCWQDYKISLMPPSKQLENNISSKNVICKEGLQLIFKHDNSPACVKLPTAEKLMERGWSISFMDSHITPKSCQLEPHSGPCNAINPRYYFDETLNSCREFTWGGCGGIVPFETLSECHTLCEIQ